MIGGGFQILTCQCWVLQGWNMPSLAAPFWRLYFNLEEGAWIRNQGKRLDFAGDSIYLIPPDVRGGTGLEAPIRHLFLHFLLDSGNTRSQALGGWPRKVESPREIRDLARTLALDLEVNPLNESEACPAAHTLLGWALARSGLAARGEQTEVHPGVARVLSALHSRHYPALSNAEMALIAHMSVNGFIRAFSAARGETPQQWLRHRRIGLACQRLVHSGDSIEQIAESLHFANRFHFSSVFRSVCGTGPATWRRKNKSGMLKVTD